MFLFFPENKRFPELIGFVFALGKPQPANGVVKIIEDFQLDKQSIGQQDVGSEQFFQPVSSCDECHPVGRKVLLSILGDDSRGLV